MNESGGVVDAEGLAWRTVVTLLKRSERNGEHALDRAG